MYYLQALIINTTSKYVAIVYIINATSHNSIPFKCTKSSFSNSGSLSNQKNLSPFTKDFRGGEHSKESIIIIFFLPDFNRALKIKNKTKFKFHNLTYTYHTLPSIGRLLNLDSV